MKKFIDDIEHNPIHFGIFLIASLISAVLLGSALGDIANLLH